MPIQSTRQPQPQSTAWERFKRAMLGEQTEAEKAAAARVRSRFKGGDADDLQDEYTRVDRFERSRPPEPLIPRPGQDH
ncbi:MAG: hypothetical protein AB7S38_38760 [Vulcanimicrobiota bacterium]